MAREVASEATEEMNDPGTWVAVVMAPSTADVAVESAPSTAEVTVLRTPPTSLVIVSRRF